MILDFQTLTRSETNATIIATLKRKGWVERPDPPIVSATQKATWNGSAWVVTTMTPDEKKASWTYAQLIAKLTTGERAAIVAQARADIDAAAVKDWVRQHTLADLVTLGLLTDARRLEILG